MKIVKANAKLIPHDVHPYVFIERVGRTCYKSEDKITPDSAKRFVEMLAKKQHGAMLEHEYLYLKFYTGTKEFIAGLTDLDQTNMRLFKYMNIQEHYISASFRAWIEFFNEVAKIDKEEKTYSVSGWPKAKGIYAYILKMFHNEYPEVFKAPAEYGWKENATQMLIATLSREGLIEDIREEIPDKTSQNETISALLPHTVLFVCDRGVSHEFVRHRPASYGQESTRYCNYANGKFGSEITVIEPLFYADDEQKYNTWKTLCLLAEQNYNRLIEMGSTAQEARDILPTSLKTEIFITATENEWQHIVNLRYHGTTGAPHPQMKEVMAIALPQLEETSENRIS